MTDVQKILYAMATGYHDGQIGEEDCDGIAKALNGVPESYHMGALKSFLGIQEEQSEEQPEDYLAVKTFTSPVFHVGDEVTVRKTGKKGIITHVGDELIFCVLYATGGSSTFVKGGDEFTRTGRNFPAIPAILEELKKG